MAWLDFLRKRHVHDAPTLPERPPEPTAPPQSPTTAPRAAPPAPAPMPAAPAPDAAPPASAPSRHDWHYMLGHEVLRDASLRDQPDRFEQLAAPGAFEGLVETSMQAVGRQCGLDAAAIGDILRQIRVHRRIVGGNMAVVVQMPPPGSPPEAHFVAILRRMDDRALLYFTLEAGQGGANFMCGWTADGSHLNFGDGPPAELDAFLRALAERLPP